MVTVIEVSKKLDILTENLCRYFENIQKKNEAMEQRITSLDDRLNNLHSTVNILLSTEINKDYIEFTKETDNDSEIPIKKNNDIRVDINIEKNIDNCKKKNIIYSRRHAL